MDHTDDKSDARDHDWYFTRIDIHDEWQCRYWSRQFGVRPKHLKRAVKSVGNRVDDVMRYLDVLHRDLSFEQKVYLLQMIFGAAIPKLALRRHGMRRGSATPDQRIESAGMSTPVREPECSDA